jgi:hypothetical protein
LVLLTPNANTFERLPAMACVWQKAMNRRVVKPKKKMHCQRSLSAFFRLVGSAQAARSLAGGLPLAALGRNQSLQNALTFAAIRQTGRMSQLPELCKTLTPSLSRQLRSRAVERKARVRPNPSIERTSTGLARFTSQVYVPLRGPSRFRPAHVKR